MYRGDIALSQILDIKFTTVAASTGAPTQLTGSPVISVYQTNSTTQSTTGVTLTVDFDSVTGLNHVRIDTSADGTFYAAGRDFQIVITTGTVGGTSAVGYVVGEFSINNRAALRPATAGRTLVVDASGLADANVVKLGPTGSGTAQTARDVGASVLLSSGTGTGQLDFTSGVVKANLAQILGTALTETAGLLAGGFKKFFNVATPTGTVNSIPDAVAGAAGGLFIAGSNAATTVNITGNITGNLSGSVGSVTGAVGSVTAGVTLATSAVQAIWDALTSALTTAGSIGKLLVDNITGNAFTRLGAPVGASISADIAAVKAQVVTINADTDDIQTRLPAALVSGRIDASVGSYPGNTAQTGDSFARLGAPAGASVSADVAAVKVDTAAIKAKTDNLPASPAAVGSAMTLATDAVNAAAVAADAVTEIQSGLATAAAVTAVASNVTAIKAKTDNLPAAPAAVGDIPTANQNADALLDRANAIEAGLTLRQAHRIEVAAAGGKLSGAATTTVTVRNAQADSKNRIVATVDADGNRSAVTLDVT